jgi:transcriptional regulator with XRE-family HTH domain
VIELDGRRQGPSQRLEFLQATQRMLTRGDVTMGQALRVLRAAFLRLDRGRFAQVVGVSRRELAKIESDQANSTISTLDRVFRPFGLRVGLVPREPTTAGTEPDALTDDRYREWLDAVRAAVARHSRR